MAKSKRKINAENAEDRRQRVAALRAQQKAQERRSKALRYGSGGLLGAGVIALIVVLVINQSGKTTTAIGEQLPTPVPPTPHTTQGALKTVPNTSGIPGVVEYDTTAAPNSGSQTPPGATSHLHVTGQVTYAVTPPVGGPHNADWLTCGVYDQPVPNERAVHDLEHGAVWITYRPSLPAAQVTALQNFIRGQKNATITVSGVAHDLGAKYLDLSPWADDTLPSPVVISSWGAQLRVDSVTDSRLQKFIDVFRIRPDQSSEAGSAPCSANPNGDGGRPLFS